MDFTVKKYISLLQAFKKQGYVFQSFRQYLETPAEKVIVLRHDVDKRPGYSLRTAKIELEMGITGSYYFRTVPESLNEPIIREIHSMGHEIGYHYENLATCKGNYELGIADFEKNLAVMRKLVPVDTICMHGSPLSPYDSRLLWGKYNYQDYGLFGEPYFDIDFTEVFYLTDTGRRWNSNKMNIRDKVEHMSHARFLYRTTNHIIKALVKDELPDKIMITVHPQRWTDKPIPWINELIVQNIKNIVKSIFIKRFY